LQLASDRDRHLPTCRVAVTDAEDDHRARIVLAGLRPFMEQSIADNLKFCIFHSATNLAHKSALYQKTSNILVSVSA
jgi:hypothetical protein